MYGKRIAALGMAVLLAAALPVLPVSAHGHHQAQAKTAVKADRICDVCTVKGCEETGLHIHDEKLYCGYEHAGGYCDGSCDPVAVCGVAGCTETGHHVHDQVTYCGYAHEGGYCDGTCDAVRVCAVEGCTRTGHHVHDQVTYCGYAHEGGYCDGTCGSACGRAVSQTQNVCGGHHGHHGR